MGGTTGSGRTLQDIVNVHFPRALSLSESEDLLTALAKELPGRANYNYSVIRSVDGTPDGSTTTLQSLAGMLIRSEPYACVGFHLERSSLGAHSDLETFDNLRFATTVGYELDELDPAELVFMDDLRKRISTYFSKQ